MSHHHHNRNQQPTQHSCQVAGAPNMLLSWLRFAQSWWKYAQSLLLPSFMSANAPPSCEEIYSRTPDRYLEWKMEVREVRTVRSLQIILSSQFGARWLCRTSPALLVLLEIRPQLLSEPAKRENCSTSGELQNSQA